MEVKIPKPLFEGTLRFDSVQEGPSHAEHRTIAFTPPLMVEYTVWPEEDGKGGFINPDKPYLAFFTFDFGMTGEVPMQYEHNFLLASPKRVGYEGLTTESTPEEIVIKMITFDLFHAFCHCEMDPNYTPYHWALLGWLKDRAKVTEPD